jgi:hypothetical protein
MALFEVRSAMCLPYSAVLKGFLTRVGSPFCLRGIPLVERMLHLFSVTLLCASIVGLSSGAATPTCKKPSVRKEWRALGHDGQKAFADAIKAGVFLFVYRKPWLSQDYSLVVFVASSPCKLDTNGCHPRFASHTGQQFSLRRCSLCVRLHVTMVLTNSHHAFVDIWTL